MPESKAKNLPVDQWLKRETPHKREALENASRHFDATDSLTVNTLEGIYGQESSFGIHRGKRGSNGPSGDFQIDRKTANRIGLSTSIKDDQRFNLEHASAAAAKHLKTLDELFRKETTLSGNLRTTPISDPNERKKFAIAAYNAGEGRIAKAQEKAKKDGKDPEKWSDVRNYLEAAGASPRQRIETQEYVDKVCNYESDFSKKSKADKQAKDKPKIMKNPPDGGHWITLHGRHIFIKER